MPVEEHVSCIYDVNKKCGYPHRLQTSSTPKVFVISSSDFKNIVEWFKTVFSNHILTEDEKEFDVVYFSDSSNWDFCNNVCVPIHEAWFCIAIVKEEMAPIITKRKSNDIIVGYITRINSNVFFEVGLALAWNKGIIFYKGNKQQLPSDWNNLANLVIDEPNLCLSPVDTSNLMAQLKQIIELNPFIPKSVKWKEADTNE